MEGKSNKKSDRIFILIETKIHTNKYKLIDEETRRKDERVRKYKIIGKIMNEIIPTKIFTS